MRCALRAAAGLMMPSASTTVWIASAEMPRVRPMSAIIEAQTSSRSFCTCSRFSGLIEVRVKGSAKDLYLPTRVSCTPMPYFSKAPAKKMGWLARPGIRIMP